MRRRDAKRVFVVTDQVLRNAGVVELIETTLRELTDAEFRIYEKGQVAPSFEAVKACAEELTGYDADLVVGLGGGSNLDLAKVARVVARQASSELRQCVGFDKVPDADYTFLVCIPTTAGTGSEVSHSSLLREESDGSYVSVLSQRIRPDIAIVDPYLCITCPSKTTAASGMTALSHAVEAFLVPNFFSLDEQPGDALPFEGNNPLGDMYAEKAIRLIGQHLVRATQEPEDLAARSGMSFAATLAGVGASQCGMGIGRSLIQAVGKVSDLTHGETCAFVLPEVMRFFARHRSARLEKVGEWLAGGPVASDSGEAVEQVLAQVDELRTNIGLPSKLGDVSIPDSQLDELANAAILRQHMTSQNAAVPSEQDLREMLQRIH